MLSLPKLAILLALPTALIAGTSLAEPAPAEGAPSGEASPKAGSDTGMPKVNVSEARSRLEGGMESLGSMAQTAKQDGDAVLSACLEDKVTRGQDVMEVATSEILVLNGKGSSAQEKSFAAEKLGAAADRMDGIVSLAKACSGDQSPTENDDVTANELDKTDQIPLEDPTVSPTIPPIPPAVDQGQPPTVASPTI